MGKKKRPAPRPTIVEAPRYRYPIPMPTRKRGLALLEQQLWCFGRDILRAEGNLLLAYGFDRDRLPKEEKGSTAYFCSVSPTVTLWMWGFGLFWGDTEWGGLFLRRFGFDPHYTAAPIIPAGTWREDRMIPTHTPASPEEGAATHTLLLPLIEWLAAYETWAQATAGIDHRRRAISMLDKRKQVSHDDVSALPGLWRAVAGEIEAAYQAQTEGSERSRQSDPKKP